MWVYWQGVRVHIEHNVHARELDFLVKDDLVGREVTMVHFFKFWAPFNWPTFNRTFHHLLRTQTHILTGAIFVAMSVALSLILASTIYIGYDEPLQDETIMRIKGFLWKTFLFLSVGWFEVDSCLICIQVLRFVPPPFPVLNPAISQWRRHQRLKCEPVAPWGR